MRSSSDTSSGPAAARRDEDSKPGKRRPFRKIGDRIAAARDHAERALLEADEPDATGRWEPEHRAEVLKYVWERDGRRCGLCGGQMKIDGAHVEHVVPKVLAVFDLRGGRAIPGTRWRSRLHKLDNLQAAHTYCNRRKGNSDQPRSWRHPSMPPLTVADADDGRKFVVPKQ